MPRIREDDDVDADVLGSLTKLTVSDRGSVGRSVDDADQDLRRSPDQSPGHAASKTALHPMPDSDSAGSGGDVQPQSLSAIKLTHEQQQQLLLQQAKLQICYDFTKGSCSRGDKCKFSHDLATIVNFNSKEKGICFDYLRNQCQRGLLCRFSHDLSSIAQQCQVFNGTETKGRTNAICYDFVKGVCQRGNECRYSHDLGLIASTARGGDGCTPCGEVCYDYLRGRCTRGLSCRFSHNMAFLEQGAAAADQYAPPFSGSGGDGVAGYSGPFGNASEHAALHHQMMQQQSYDDGCGAWPGQHSRLREHCGSWPAASPLGRGCDVKRDQQSKRDQQPARDAAWPHPSSGHAPNLHHPQGGYSQYQMAASGHGCHPGGYGAPPQHQQAQMAMAQQQQQYTLMQQQQGGGYQQGQQKGNNGCISDGAYYLPLAMQGFALAQQQQAVAAAARAMLQQQQASSYLHQQQQRGAMLQQQQASSYLHQQQQRGAIAASMMYGDQQLQQQGGAFEVAQQHRQHQGGAVAASAYQNEQQSQGCALAAAQQHRQQMLYQQHQQSVVFQQQQQQTAVTAALAQQRQQQAGRTSSAPPAVADACVRGVEEVTAVAVAALRPSCVIGRLGRTFSAPGSHPADHAHAALPTGLSEGGSSGTRLSQGGAVPQATASALFPAPSDRMSGATGGGLALSSSTSSGGVPAQAHSAQAAAGMPLSLLQQIWSK